MRVLEQQRQIQPILERFWYTSGSRGGYGRYGGIEEKRVKW